MRAAAAAGSPGAWISDDTRTYLAMAQGILTGEPFAYFPNGYPLLIVAVWGALAAVGGAQGLFVALAALNLAVSTATVACTWALARGVVDRGWALLAASLVAFWPNQVNYARQLLTEVPATFLLVLGLLLLIRRHPFGAGVALYAAAMMRTSLLPVAALALAWVWWTERRWRPVATYAVGMALPFALETGLALAGVVAPPRNAGSNLLVAISARSTEGVTYGGQGFSEAERARPLATYLAFAAEHPREFLAQRGAALWEMWGPWPSAGAESQPRSVAVRLLIGLRFPLVVLALAEALRRWRSAPHVLLGGPIVLLTALHTAYFATARFSYPVEPLALVLAVSLLAWARGRWAGRRQSGGAKRARSQPPSSSVPTRV